MDNHKIYAIVVTFNGEKWIEKCIGSLVQSYLMVNIVVVDNGSTDNTCEIISENYPEVKLIQPGINLGFGKANNVGIVEAQMNNANFFILINQDVWVEKDTIEKLLKISLENNEYGILSPIHLDAEKKSMDLNFSFQLSSDKCPGFVSDLYLGITKEIYDVEFCPAAFWLITSDCVSKVGLFDPFFYMYGEDNNYISRVRFNKFKIGIVPELYVYHDRAKRNGKKSVVLNEALLNFNIAVLDPNKPFFRNFIVQYLLLIIRVCKSFFSLSFQNKLLFLRDLLGVLLSSFKYYKTHKSYNIS